MSENIVIILRGLPGAGKSKWIKKNLQKDTYVLCSANHFFQRDGAYHYNPDQVQKAHAACKRRFQWAVCNNQSTVVVDNTNTTLRELEFYLRLAKEKSYKIRVVRLETTLEASKVRNHHDVPSSSLERMKARFEDYSGEEIIRT